MGSEQTNKKKIKKNVHNSNIYIRNQLYVGDYRLKCLRAFVKRAHFMPPTYRPASVSQLSPLLCLNSARKNRAQQRCESLKQNDFTAFSPFFYIILHKIEIAEANSEKFYGKSPRIKLRFRSGHNFSFLSHSLNFIWRNVFVCWQ